MKKLCIITGTRAEWGLLSGLATALNARDDVRLQIIATNMHLSPKYGHTVDEIRAAGFMVDAEIPMMDDEAPSTAKETVLAMGREMTGFAEAFEKLRPDTVIILGDRYEMLVAASAALIFGIPIAHLHGGETTEGAFDDAIRHAISKLATYHFTSTEIYRERVVQMGIDPLNVYHVGALGCENIQKVPRMSRDELEASLDFALSEKFFLVTYHPVTVGSYSGRDLVVALIRALEKFPDYKVLITHPNSDAGGDEIRAEFDRFARANPSRVKLVTSLGMKRYLSAIPLSSAVIGNSSSGILEVPSFAVPTVNVGTRQGGRLRAGSVIDCSEDTESIVAALRRALAPEFKEKYCTGENPYAKAGTANAIVGVLTGGVK